MSAPPPPRLTLPEARSSLVALYRVQWLVVYVSHTHGPIFVRGRYLPSLRLWWFKKEVDVGNISPRAFRRRMYLWCRSVLAPSLAVEESSLENRPRGGVGVIYKRLARYAPVDAIPRAVCVVMPNDLYRKNHAGNHVGNPKILGIVWRSMVPKYHFFCP